MSEDKISVNEMITTCPDQYLNSHMKVTRTVVYNATFFGSCHSSTTVDPILQ